MDDLPSIERRIRAAMALAGVDLTELADRIDTPNYGERTLRKLTDPDDESRVARPGDLVLIARACNVSDAFWAVDFRKLEEPSLRAEVNDLHARLADLAVSVEQHYAELTALRGAGPRTAPKEDGER